MANGGHWESDADWQRVEAPLLQLDPVLAEFAMRFRMRTTKNLKEWPERSLLWGSSIRKLIQVYLVDQSALTFNVWLCATQDRGGERYWKQRFVISERPVAAFAHTFEHLLLDAKQELDSLTESQLEFATKLG